MEPFFAFPEWSDVWIPLGLDVDDGDRDSRWLRVVARLREGVSLEAADAELATIAGIVGRAIPRSQPRLFRKRDLATPGIRASRD